MAKWLPHTDVVKPSKYIAGSTPVLTANKKTMNWVEQTPKVGDTVRITYSDWYAKRIGSKQDIGVFLGMTPYSSGSRFKIDLGDREIHLPSESSLEVFVK